MSFTDSKFSAKASILGTQIIKIYLVGDVVGLFVCVSEVSV